MLDMQVAAKKGGNSQGEGVGINLTLPNALPSGVGNRGSPTMMVSLSWLACGAASCRESKLVSL